ncbi:Acyl-CoA ligase easD [Sparassis crispa]|uniref:Acyl-CoA ligase easD n=1 Tax=Sparassis crispa TaxID=139825 RepID=A0A401GZY6_9APHY|nr:Acyl-CoA ligase easD [Sparassis crispa]GBE87735.1 Acyl-CoA ligase easD [Sparassis crispa]
MAEISGGALPPVPDDLTIPQFMLDTHHVTRPVVKIPKPWYVDAATGRSLYASEIRARVHGLANALHSRWHIGEDDVVCLFSPNHIDYPGIIWAIHRLGAIVTAANPAYTAEELEHQLVTSKSKVIIAHPANHPIALVAATAAGIPPENIMLVDALPATAAAPYPTISALISEGLSAPQNYVEQRLKPGEGKTKLAFLSFSSGTTGKPKAVCISHYNMIANVIQVAQRATETPFAVEADRVLRVDAVALGVLPFFHIFGLVVLVHFSVYYGMTLVVLPKFDLPEFLTSIQRYRVSVIYVVPPMLVLMCKHPLVEKFDISSVRATLSGAAPLSSELTNLVATKFPSLKHVGQGFGMTETCTVVSFPQTQMRLPTPGSSGRLVNGIIARVVKPDGSLAKFGEPGELVVRGPAMALGYLDNVEATRETFRNGWVHTGDEVTINQEGELFVVDRIKELIKVKGFQVAPAELEGHLLEHPDVSDVCVVPIPDEYRGEIPLAFVALSAGAAERVKKNPALAREIKASLVKYVADAKIDYKHLAGGVEFVDVIPKNPSGKLLRRVLRDRARLLQKEGKLSTQLKAKL